MILATLATLTTAPLFTVLAAVALLAFATAGWIPVPTALLAMLIVIGLALARRYTR
jgi:CHASE2 domain-containing sensor protein